MKLKRYSLPLIIINGSFKLLSACFQGCSETIPISSLLMGRHTGTVDPQQVISLIQGNTETHIHEHIKSHPNKDCHLFQLKILFLIYLVFLDFVVDQSASRKDSLKYVLFC